MEKEVLYTKQFEIYEVDLTQKGLEILPCVIIQNNKGNMHSPTTIVMPLVKDKIEDVALYLKVNVENLGEMYIFASYVQVIDKSWITNKKPLAVINDSNIQKQIAQYYLASAGLKVIYENGEKKIIDMSEEELNVYYK